MLFSSPSLVKNASYTLYTNGTVSAGSTAAFHGFYADGTYTNGTSVGTFTATYNSTVGGTASGSPGPGGQPGKPGGRPR